MDVEKTIEFLLGQQGRFDARMAELTENMDSLIDSQIGMEERNNEMAVRHNHEMAEIRSALSRAVRLSVEEQRRERVRRHASDEKMDRMESSLQRLIDAIRKDRNGH